MFKNDKCCIYGIYCKGNNKLYIGSSITVLFRLSMHRSLLKYNKHYNKYLQRAYNKYGKDLFQFTPIEEVDNPDNLCIREAWYIDNLNTLIPNGFNILKDPTNMFGKNNPMYGLIHKEETKEKISYLAKNRLKNKENHPMYGKKHSIEARNKMSKNRIDINGKMNPMYGRKHTNDSRKKMSKSSRKLSETDVIKIRKRLGRGVIQFKISKEFGVSRATISGIKLNKIYKDVK